MRRPAPQSDFSQWTDGQVDRWTGENLLKRYLLKRKIKVALMIGG